MKGKLQEVKPPKSEKAKKKGMKWVKISGKFYSWIGDLPEVNKGTLVKFEYQEKKTNGNTYRNLQDFEPLTRKPVSNKQRLICRSVSVKAAASAGFVESKEELIELAEGLENHLLRALE
ncbi:hypothetical protein K9M06_01100 [Candidatus Bipolaricaulota bacterium]|nr:hypothetical protein [Candidatus Bipolaricaulota bacterium]